MSRPQQMEKNQPYIQTLRALEDMRIEVLHELQEGACTDVSDALIDELGALIVMLESLKAETGSSTRLPLSA